MMKIVFALTISVLLSFSTFAQDISGQWNGVIKFPGLQLRVVFNITKTAQGISATLDSPDQGAKGIPVTNASFDSLTLNLSIPAATIAYEGKLGNDGIIVGTFKQAGQIIPLNLSRKVVEKEKVLRPQEPQKPYPYFEEEIVFENKQVGIKLAGTLTLPKKEGLFPVVVLISGSGPQNRNEELMGHQPFLVLADFLTKNGIAVLRYDDRGTAASTGKFELATSADLADDVEAAVAYLKTRKDINVNKIGLIGHSEGGTIAPMVASKSTDVAFIVLLAGMAIPGNELLLLQQKLIGKASGETDDDLNKVAEINRKAFDMVKQSTSLEQLKVDLTQYIKQVLKENPVGVIPDGVSEDDFIALQVNQLASPWMQYFMKLKPSVYLEKVKCPILALNGEKDLQVPAKENLEVIKSTSKIAGNSKVTTIALPHLNHLFQESTTGLPSEYGVIEQTFSPIALNKIVDWIKDQTK